MSRASFYTSRLGDIYDPATDTWISDGSSTDTVQSSLDPALYSSDIFPANVPDFISPTGSDWITLPDTGNSTTVSSLDPGNQYPGETASLLQDERALATGSQKLATINPGQVTTSSLSDSFNFETILKGLKAIGGAVQQYNKTPLTNGGAVYTRINPLTGQPVTGGTSMSLSSLMGSGTSKIILIAGAALLAFYFLSRDR